MGSITKEGSLFKVLEQEIHEKVLRLGRQIMTEILDAWDQELMESRDTKEYRHHGKRQRVIKTVMGEVAIKRSYYKSSEGNRVFLLDETVGLNRDYGLVSENLAEHIIMECSEKSFRKAADSISSQTGQHISAQGAWDIVQQRGAMIDQQETKLNRLAEEGIEGLLGKLPCRVLFSEMDDIYLSMQRPKRRTIEGLPKEKRPKHPLHVGTAYIGWRKCRDGRYRTEGKMAHVSYGSVKEFVVSFESMLKHRYDMDEIECRILNGDGASWIKSAAEETDSILQLDPYHRNRAILRTVGKPEVGALFKSIAAGDVDELLQQVCRLVLASEDNEEREKLEALNHYLHSNIDSLLTIHERKHPLPKAPAGLTYSRNLGTQESSNCNLITHRMKHRKGSWSVSGATHMAKILCYQQTVGLDMLMGYTEEGKINELREEIVVQSVAQTPLYDGQGYGAQWLQGQLPYNQSMGASFRDLIRTRTIEHLIY
jgi:hypothetical protein